MKRFHGLLGMVLLACTKPAGNLPPSPGGFLPLQDTTTFFFPSDFQVFGERVALTGAHLQADTLDGSTEWSYRGWFVGVLTREGQWDLLFADTVLQSDLFPVRLRVLPSGKVLVTMVSFPENACFLYLVDVQNRDLQRLEVPFPPDADIGFCNVLDGVQAGSSLFAVGVVGRLGEQVSLILIRFDEEPAGSYRYTWHRLYSRANSPWNAGMFVYPSPEGLWIIGGTGVGVYGSPDDSLWSVRVSREGRWIRDSVYPAPPPNLYHYAEFPSGMVLFADADSSFPMRLFQNGEIHVLQGLPSYMCFHGTGRPSAVGLTFSQTVPRLDIVDLFTGQARMYRPFPFGGSDTLRDCLLRTGSGGIVITTWDRLFWVPWTGKRDTGVPLLTRISLPDPARALPPPWNAWDVTGRRRF